MILTNFFTCGWFLTLAYNPQTNGFTTWLESNGTTGKSWLTDQAEEDALVEKAIKCFSRPQDICNSWDR